MSQKDDKVMEIIREKAAQFLQRESNGASMITVTRVTLSGDGKRAIIFFTVFPETKEKPVIDFTKRIRSDFKMFIRDETRLNRIPFFDFELDKGEKNRQLIDSLSNL